MSSLLSKNVMSFPIEFTQDQLLTISIGQFKFHNTDNQPEIDSTDGWSVNGTTKCTGMEHRHNLIRI